MASVVLTGEACYPFTDFCPVHGLSCSREPVPRSHPAAMRPIAWKAQTH